jgi:hypothetical protein
MRRRLADQRAVEIQASGSMKNLSQENALQLPIPIPDPEKRSQYGVVADGCRALRMRNLEALRQAEHLFQTLLHEAFGEA